MNAHSEHTAPPSPQGGGGASACDVVVPVYNGLSFVKDCLESILAHTSDVSYRLLLVDDASDAVTAAWLDDAAAVHAHVEVLRNPENLGFVQSCNKGMRHGAAPFVVLVNTDVVVTDGWLSRLIDCAASDPRIGSVNPLTNYASQINVAMHPGVSFRGMDAYLRAKNEGNALDIVTGVGFCLMLRREALEHVGFFDEIYGMGYCEESDLCMRLTTNGWRTVAVDNVYLYHKGKATFTGRDERYRKNRAIFDERWLAEYQRQFAAFRQADPLGPVRDAVAAPQAFAPRPRMVQTYRALREAWQDRDVVRMGVEALRGCYHLPKSRRDVTRPEGVARFADALARREGGAPLSVTYVLRDLVVAGGVLSAIQLVNELILLGVDARIAALYEDPILTNWTRCYTRPMIFRNERDLVRNLPPTDIAVATLWITAEWVAGLVGAGRAKTAAYFLQDYEPWFFPEADVESRQRVRAGYGLIGNKIVKSAWLAGMLAADGHDTHQIRLGMDLGRYYPRDTGRGEPGACIAGACLEDSSATLPKVRPVLLAMARPGTPRRGFDTLVQACARIRETLPDIEIVFFGDGSLSGSDLPFPFRDEGVVGDQNKLAALYSEAHVFVDSSDFQGFGRCGLEAMACGAACVLTEVGGVGEYARHRENALLVPPKDPGAIAGAVLELLCDGELRAACVAGGYATVRAYDHKREARETLAYFERIARKAGRGRAGRGLGGSA